MRRRCDAIAAKSAASWFVAQGRCEGGGGMQGGGGHGGAARKAAAGKMAVEVGPSCGFC